MIETGVFKRTAKALSGVCI